MAGTKSTAKQNWRQCLAGGAGFKVVHSCRNNFRLIGLEDETITSGHLRRWPVDIPVHFTFRKGGMCDPRPDEGGHDSSTSDLRFRYPDRRDK
jgi:hypothetical protein